jgi:hypothetical protein
LHIDEALDQANERRFAGAGQAHHAEVLSRRDPQIEVVKNLLPVRVPKGDSLKLDAAAHTPKWDGLWRILNFMWAVNNA